MTIEEQIDQFIKNKNNLINRLLYNCDWDKRRILEVIEKNNILPYSNYYEWPDFFDKFINQNDDYLYKYEKINFVNILDIMYEELNNQNSDKDISLIMDNYLNELFELVREKKIIGCHYDW